MGGPLADRCETVEEFLPGHDTGAKPQTADLLKRRVLGCCIGETREKTQTIWDNLEASLGRDRMGGLLHSIAATKTQALTTADRDTRLSQLFSDLEPTAELGPVFRRLQYLSWVVRHETWRLPALHWLTQAGYESPDTLPFLKRLEALAWTLMIKAEEPHHRDRRYLAILDEIDRGTVLMPGRKLEVSAAERAAVRAILTGPNLARRPYKLFLLLRLDAIYDGDAAVTITPEATMEHIFPQRPAAASRWAEAYRQTPDAAALRHMLGNLTLLTEAEQNLAGNRDFHIKRAVFAGSAFTLTRRIATATEWRAEEIRARTEALADDFLEALGLR
jgi:hypothetical protein